MTNAFTHKPKKLYSETFVHPTATRALWNALWAEARKQDWWVEDNTIGLVGDQDGYFYFQKNGLTTGFARVKLPA